MTSLAEARGIAHAYYDNLSSKVYETDDYWVFKYDTHGIATAGGGDPVAVSKDDGSSRILYFVLDESWEILDAMKPVVMTD